MPALKSQSTQNFRDAISAIPVDISLKLVPCVSAQATRHALVAPIAGIAIIALFALTSPSALAKPDAELNTYVISIVNADRTKAHAVPLVESPALDRVAQLYAEYLMRTNTLEHIDGFGRNPEQRAAYLGVQIPVAENLAYEMDSDGNIRSMLKDAEAGMMNEPKNQQNHRANIVNPAHRFIGIGIAKTTDSVVLVQEFTEEPPR